MSPPREPLIDVDAILEYADKHLEDEREEERALAMSPAEVAAELTEAGADQGVVRSMALEVLARHQAPTADASGPVLPVAHDETPEPAQAVDQPASVRAYDPPEEPRRLRPERARPVWLVPVAAAIALAAAIVLLIVLLPDQGIAPPHLARNYEPQPEPTPDERRAAGLRDEGLRACGEDRYEECLARLDEAATLDPAGDRTQPVREARGVIVRMLAPPEPTPPPPRPPPPRPAPQRAPRDPNAPGNDKVP
jgi:hypothetical protein